MSFGSGGVQRLRPSICTPPVSCADTLPIKGRDERSPLDKPTDIDAGAPSEPLRLPDYLPYRLSVVSNKASGLIARAYQARFGLSIWEWRVIAVLGGEGRPLTAQAVCEATAMDKVTVSRAIRALDARGLLTRQPNAEDKRASDVTLTTDGQVVYAEIVPSALEYEARMLADFSQEERTALKALLEKLERRLEGGPIK